MRLLDFGLRPSIAKRRPADAGADLIAKPVAAVLFIFPTEAAEPSSSWGEIMAIHRICVSNADPISC
ncbi:MAG: hypothetical protein AAFX08_11565 [Pseudomonadota bacterium]